MTLKIKFHDFTIQTRSKTFEQYPDAGKIWETVMDLLEQEELKKQVRLFGIGISNLNVEEERLHFGKQLNIEFGEG